MSKVNSLLTGVVFVSITPLCRSDVCQWLIFRCSGECSPSLPGGGFLTSRQMSAQALIAQKKAEIAAKIAAMTKNATSAAATPTPPPKPSPSPALATPPPASGAGTPTDDIARRVAEAKRRVAEAQSKLAVKDNPYMVRSSVDLS